MLQDLLLPPITTNCRLLLMIRILSLVRVLVAAFQMILVSQQLLFVPTDSSNQNRSEIIITILIPSMPQLPLPLPRTQRRIKYVNPRTLPNPFSCNRTASRNGWIISSKRTKLPDSSSTAVIGESCDPTTSPRSMNCTPLP